MLTNLVASALHAIVKKSKLEMMAEIEEIIERDGETCAQFVSNELGVTLKEAMSLIRGLLTAEGIFKGEERTVGCERRQFYTNVRPRNVQGSLLQEPVRRDPLVAFLFGEAK